MLEQGERDQDVVQLPAILSPETASPATEPYGDPSAPLPGVNIDVLVVDQRVIVQLSRSVSWFELSPAQARTLAENLRQQSRRAEGVTQHSKKTPKEKAKARQHGRRRHSA